jgi:WD40 repeat protein
MSEEIRPPDGRLWMQGRMNKFSIVTSTPDGRYVVTGSPRKVSISTFRTFGLIYLWDGETGKLLQIFEPAYGTMPNFQTIAISPDARWVVAGFECGDYIIWDARTGKRTFYGILPFASEKQTFQFTPDGRYFVADGSNDSALVVVDPATGQIVRSFGGPRCFRMTDMVFSHDGKTIYVASHYLDQAIHAFDYATGARIGRFEMEGIETQLAVSSDGRYLAACPDLSDQVRVWRLPGGDSPLILKYMTPYSIAFSVSGDSLLIAGFRKSTSRYCISIYSMSQGREVGWIDKTPMGLRIRMTGRGNRLAGVYDQLWYYDLDTDSTTVCSWRMCTFWDPGFTADSRRVAVKGVEGVLLFDAETGEVVRTIPSENPSEMSITSNVSFSPDGKYCAFSEGRGVRVLDAVTYAEVFRDTTVDTTHLVEFSPDSRLLTWVNGLNGRGVVYDVERRSIMYAFSVPMQEYSEICEIDYAYDGAHVFLPATSAYCNVVNYVEKKTGLTGGSAIAFTSDNVYAMRSQDREMSTGFNFYVRYIRRSGPTWDVYSSWQDFQQGERWYYTEKEIYLYDLEYHPTNAVIFAMDYGYYDSLQWRVYDGSKIRWARMQPPDDDSLRILYNLGWQFAYELAISPDGRLLATMGGMGNVLSVWSVPEGLVGIEKEPAARSDDPAILFCAPHPVTDRAMLTVSVPSAGTMSVSLYDALGRKVRDVYAGLCQAGTTRLQLNAFGLRGVYYLRLAQGGRSAVRAVVFVDQP